MVMAIQSRAMELPEEKGVKWGGMDPYTHTLVVGPTRCGKTATILKPIIYQLLTLKASGVPLGMSVIEPKGDVAAMVAEMAEEMGLPYTHIDPMLGKGRFNPMEGEINAVAEATVVVLKGLFGKQDAFFATVQELSARNVTKLLKELHGDNMDIIDVMNTLRDEKELTDKVSQLKARDGMTDLVHFFESELLGSMKEKYRQFVIGLRAQLENVVSNVALRKIMTGKSSFSIDEHYENGGILAVNTALGMLRSSGDAFGQFIMMHLQNGAFRRGGTENTRVPHFLIVDETSRYINPDIEIFLNLAAEYRVAGVFAIQSLGQLELESGKLNAKAMKRAILGGCRNVIVFGGIKSEDAKDFAEEFGKDKILMRQSTYKNNILLPNLFPDSYRDTEEEEYRFDATDLMDGLPRFHFVHKLLQDGHPQKPNIAKGVFVPRDWKEQRVWENHKSVKDVRKQNSFDLSKLTSLFKKLASLSIKKEHSAQQNSISNNVLENVAAVENVELPKINHTENDNVVAVAKEGNDEMQSSMKLHNLHTLNPSNQSESDIKAVHSENTSSRGGAGSLRERVVASESSAEHVEGMGDSGAVNESSFENDLYTKNINETYDLEQGKINIVESEIEKETRSPASSVEEGKAEQYASPHAASQSDAVEQSGANHQNLSNSSKEVKRKSESATIKSSKDLFW